MMPVMDGQDFQKIIYSDKLLSTILSLLTAKTADNLMRQCFDEVPMILTKPFKTTELLRTIELKIEIQKTTNSTNFIKEIKELFHEINTLT
jgi:CheY-like chemotaxis protein